MSILGDNAHIILVLPVIGIILALAIPFILAMTVGVFRPANVIGPERIPSNRPAIGLFAVMVLGLCGALFVGLLYGTLKSRGKGYDPTNPTIGELAFVNTVPALAGFMAMLCADGVIGGVFLLKRLGLDWRRLWSGIAQGLLAGVIVIPLTFLMIPLSEWFYRLIHYQHESEHELLRAMAHTEHHPALRAVMILGAVLIAPLAEEFFFRAHLQTLLKRAIAVLTMMYSPRPPGAGPGLYSPPLLENTVDERTAPGIHASVWQTWMAVGLSSVIFAMVHPMWMRPPLLVLALGLGYSYERTGNLWVNVTVHALFNGVSTSLFLFSLSS